MGKKLRIYCAHYKLYIMKKITMALAILVISIPVFAQQMVRSKNVRTSCPKVYLGVSTGLESQGGLVGFTVDVPVASQVSVGGGLGISSWGTKLYAEGRYYFRPCQRGWAIGAGITHNTGLNNFHTELPSNYGGNISTTLDLHPVTNGFVSGYHFFNLGRSGRHRFYLQAGYSFRLTDDNYTVVSGGPLSADARSVMTILQPGGIMLGLGFSFGIGG
jgi:hypothetical protein